MNFTLQFVAPDQRLGLLRRIRQALLPGGALILSEKLRFADAQEHALLTDLHIAFKRANGYSEPGDRAEAQRAGKRHAPRHLRGTP